MTQTDLFGDAGPMATKIKYPTQPADATRRSGLTCWKDCGYCEPELLGHASKVYRRCSRVGSKCFPTSEICEWSDRCDDVAVAKPVTTGWDDF